MTAPYLRPENRVTSQPPAVFSRLRGWTPCIWATSSSAPSVPWHGALGRVATVARGGTFVCSVAQPGQRAGALQVEERGHGEDEAGADEEGPQEERGCHSGAPCKQGRRCGTRGLGRWPRGPGALPDLSRKVEERAPYLAPLDGAETLNERQGFSLLLCLLGACLLSPTVALPEPRCPPTCMGSGQACGLKAEGSGWQGPVRCEEVTS